MTVVVADDRSSVKDLTSRHSMIRLLAHHSSGCTRKCGFAIVATVVFADMIWFFPFCSVLVCVTLQNYHMDHGFDVSSVLRSEAGQRLQAEVLLSSPGPGVESQPPSSPCRQLYRK